VAAPLARSLTVAVLAAVAAAGCSGSSAPKATTQRPAPSPSSTASDASSAAVAVLQKAETVATATRSFTFVATEVISGAGSHATTVRGNVVRGQGVSYVLTANGRTSQVVRLKAGTYVRAVPGRWSKLRKPRPVTDPIGSLLAVLHGATTPAVRQTATGSVVEAQLPAAAAKAAQLPATVQPSRLQITTDTAGHVVRLVVTTTVTSGATVTLTTTYAAFGAVRPLKPPA
jgi:hypothetical protein